MPKPQVIHQPETHEALRRGISALNAALSPTLGPLPRRSVAQNQDKFELLDDGGLIARRIVALPSQLDDVGAMLLRQVVWKMREEHGDGTATTALLYETIYREGRRYIAAGADPMRLRANLLELLPAMSERLTAGARRLRTEAELQALAMAICYDEAMARSLGEVMHTLGRYGQVDIREGHGRGTAHEYVAGCYFPGGALSKEFLRGSPRLVAEMHDAALLVTDMTIEEPAELVPALQLSLRNGIKRLLLVVESISDKGLAVALDKRLHDKIRCVIVKLEEFHPGELRLAQDDIALLCGGRPVLRQSGQSLQAVRLSDFGRARWVWADDKNFGFASGQGDARLIRGQVRRLRRSYAEADEDDARARTLKRLGRLNGGLATVYVGGIAKDEIRQRKDMAERAIRALRSASAAGVIPGGGLALLNCRDWLRDEADEQPDLESRAARMIMAKAAEAPIRQLLENAGYDSSEILARLGHCAPGSGFDVMTGAISDMAAAGIVDVAQIQAEALRRAVSSAALALTIDVLVLHRQPETMTEP